MHSASSPSVNHLAPPRPAPRTQHAGAALDALHLCGENSELKIQILRWRKKAAVLRLKISSSEETAMQLHENQQVVHGALLELADENDALKHQLHEAQGLQVRNNQAAALTAKEVHLQAPH